LDFLLHAYQVPEPLPPVWYFNFYETANLSRFFCILVFLGFFVHSGMIVLLGGDHVDGLKTRMMKASCVL
jgi:hypothetical protein